MPLLEFWLFIGIPIMGLMPLITWLLYRHAVLRLLEREHWLGNYTVLRQMPSDPFIDVQYLESSDEPGNYAKKLSKQIRQFDDALKKLKVDLRNVFGENSLTYMKYQEVIKQTTDSFNHNTTIAASVIMNTKEASWNTTKNEDVIGEAADGLAAEELSKLDDILSMNQITIQFVSHLDNMILLVGENPTDDEIEQLADELENVSSHIKYYS